MDELLSEFLTESGENIATLDVELVRLEQTPDDPKLLGNIFRLVHTVKGTCGFLGLPRLEAVAHASENVLGKIRDGELAVTPDGVTLILASIDRIKDILAQLEATEAEPEGDDSELIGQLNALASEGDNAPAEDALAIEDIFESAPAAEEVAAERSLFDRIGGQAAVDAAVGIFYSKVLADELLAPFFKNTDLDSLRRMPALVTNLERAAAKMADGSLRLEIHNGGQASGRWLPWALVVVLGGLVAVLLGYTLPKN